MIETKWEVKKGNKSVKAFLIKDEDNNIIQNLASAVTIKWQVKKNEKDAVALIEKTKGSGIEVDQPSTGYLRITVLSTDSAGLDVKKYYQGLEIDWGSGSTYEVYLYIDGRLTETFEITQDIVR